MSEIEIEDILNYITSTKLKTLCDLYGLKTTARMKKGELVNQLLETGMNKNMLLNYCGVNLDRLKNWKLAREKKKRKDTIKNRIQTPHPSGSDSNSIK